MIGLMAVLLAPSVAEADSNDNIDTSQRITVGSVQRVTIWPSGDEDWFAIALDANKSYSIRLEASCCVLHPRLFGIYDADGNPIPSTKEGTSWLYQGRTTHLIFDPTVTGDYYIHVGVHVDFVFYGATSGAYDMEVTEVPADAIPANASTTATATLEQTRGVYVAQPGDRDWIGIAMAAGRKYKVEMLGCYSCDDYPALYGILDSSGILQPNTTQLSIKYSSHPDATIRLFFTAPEDGTYYLDVGAYPETTGHSWMTVYDVSDDDYAASAMTTGTISSNGSVKADIEMPGDVDWFKTTLTTGRRIESTRRQGTRPHIWP